MLPVFMVSLEPDTERRKALQKRFSEKYREFYHVKAVDGRKLSAKHYFTEVYPYFKEYNRLISPSELGCTLSHLSALKQFLDSGADRALIIEDDILGSDEDLDKIASISKIMPDNSLLICGGQIGIGARYLFGSFNASLGCYDVATFSHAHIYGTCCYVVTRKSAGAIVGCQRVMKTLADKWDFFFKNTDIKIRYLNVLSHPVDLGGSHIEADRRLRETSMLKKIMSMDFIFKVFRKFRNELYVLAFRFLPGWVRLP